MSLTVPGSPVCQLWGDDVDGLGTNNASLADGSHQALWKNLGSGADATRVAAQNYQPTLLKVANAGHDAIVFDQHNNFFDLPSSATSLGFIHQTGIFDIVLVFRPDFDGSVNLLASTNAGADKGFQVLLSVSNVLQLLVMAGSTILFFTTTLTFTQGVWRILRIRGDGTHAFVSQDGGAEQTSSAFGSFAAGNMTRDAQLGQNPAGTPSNMGALVAFLGIWSTPLSSGDWTTFLAALQAYYSI